MDEKKAHYVVATGIIIKEGKYLITKRSDKEKAFPGLWTVPGGKIETSDYMNRKHDTDAGQWYNVVEDSLRREINEETGLSVGKINYLASLTFIRPDGIPTLVISMYSDYRDGEVKLCEDMTDHAWVDIEEAKKYALIPGIFEELLMVDKCLKGQSIGEWGR